MIADLMAGLMADLNGVLAAFGGWQLLLLCAVVMFAAVLRSFTGFGFGLAAMPIFAMLMVPSQAVVLSVALALAVSLLSLKTYWGKYPLRALLPMLIAAALGTAVGTALLSNISATVFQLSLGLSVITASLVLAFYQPALNPKSKRLRGVTGLLAGILNGALAIPGPPVIVFAMATEPDPVRSRSLLMTFFLFSGIAALVTYAVAGFITVQSGWLFLLAFPAMFVGDKLGFYLFDRYGSGLYRHIAIGVLLLIGVSITIKAML